MCDTYGATPCHTASTLKILLASSSPRRKRLLASVGIDCHTFSPDVDETPRAGERGDALASRLARSKAQASLAQPSDCEWGLSADTVVWLDDEAFGKPEDDADACRMLGRLSGRAHAVTTGFALFVPGGDVVHVGAATTTVVMRALSDAAIRGYVGSGEAAGKAGAYAIQERGGALVERIEGSFSNVVGLPVAEVVEALKSVSGDARWPWEVA